MSETGKQVTDFTARTELVDGDVMPFVRTTDSNSETADSIINKTNLFAQIQALITSNYTPVTIPNSFTQSITLGAVATYGAFKIEFLFGSGDDRFTGNIELFYEGSTPMFIDPNGGGSIDLDNLTFDASISSGQMRWKITNNTGGDLYLKYRISELKPAI